MEPQIIRSGGGLRPSAATSLSAGSDVSFYARRPFLLVAVSLLSLALGYGLAATSREPGSSDSLRANSLEAVQCPAQPACEQVEIKDEAECDLECPTWPTYPSPSACPAPAAPSACPAVPNTAAVVPAAVAGAPVCALQFVRYEPSALEREWETEARASVDGSTRVCIKLMDSGDKWLPRLKTWIDLGVSIDNARAGPTTGALVDTQHAALASASGVLSRLMFRNTCTGAEQAGYIAPLAGLLRDPRPICNEPNVNGHERWASQGIGTVPGDDNQAKESIIFDPAYLAAVRATLQPDTPDGRPTRCAYLFDAGATKYTVSGGYSSLRWFIARYAAAGIKVSKSAGRCRYSP